MSLLARYVVREMMGPFLFGLAAFTILFFSVETLMGVARMIVEQQAGYHLIGEYLGNRLPGVVVYTCPMAVLLAGLLAFGRLSGESELTALKAAGVGFLRVAYPGLVFCFTLCLGLVYLNDEVVPPTMKRSLDIIMSLNQHQTVRTFLLTAPRLLANGEEQVVYVNKLDVENKTMEGVYIHYFIKNHRIREVYADKAIWNGRVWSLSHMESKEYNEKGEEIADISSENDETPMAPLMSPGSPQDLAHREFRPEEMSRKELWDHLARMPELARGDAKSRHERNKYEVMYYQKCALPWTSLIFGLFAIPLGVRPQRSSRSMGLGLSLLFILVYYVLMAVGMALGEAGSVTPLVAAWFPNLVFGVLGILLLLEASRR